MHVLAEPVCSDLDAISDLSEIPRRALRHAGERANLFLEHTAHTRLDLKQQATRLQVGAPAWRGSRTVLSGAGLQVHAGAQAYYAAVDGLTPEAFGQLDGRMAEQVRSGAVRFQASEQVREPERTPLEPSDAPAASALLTEAADAAMSLDERVRSVTVQYYSRDRQTRVAVSDGTDVSSGTVHTELRVCVRLDVSGRMVDAYAMSGWTGAAAVDRAGSLAAREAVERAARLAEARPMPSGVMPVVLSGGWGGAWLHEAAGHFLEADTAASNAPDWRDLIGRRVAAEGIIVVDDPMLGGGRGSYVCDDEGTPASPTVLIEDGRLCGFLTDFRHARLFGLPITGHGRRQDFRYAPLPRMANLLLRPGAADPQDLIRDVKDGLFVQALGEGICYPAEGRYALRVAEGRRIANGKLAHPVADIWISGKARDSLNGITGVGCDFLLDTARGQCVKAGQVVPVSAGMPTVLVQGLGVGKPA